MADSSQHSDNQPQGDADEQAPPEHNDEARWWGLPIFAWSIVLSVLLHGLVAAPFIAWELAPAQMRLETEWLEQFERLEGLGHGATEGRWANIDDLPEPEEALEKEDKETAPDISDKLDPDLEPPDPEANDEPDFDEEDPAALREDAAAEKTAPAEREDASDAQEPSAEARGGNEPFDEAKPLPGVEQAGPSDIPDLKHYGPGNARVTALIRLDRIRDTDYAQPVRRLIQALPDFRILAESTGFDPINDLDAFFMASAKPQYIQHTFLAFRHQMTDRELKEVLDNRFREPVPWEMKDDHPLRRLVPESSGYRDPRKVMLAKPGLTVVGRDEWLEEIARDLPDDSPLREHETAHEAPSQASMLDGLAQIERAAASEDTIVVTSAQGLAYHLPGLGRMQFEGVRLSVTNPNAPRLDVDLKFSSAQEARKFERDCPTRKRRLKKGAGLDGGFGGLATNAMGLGDVIDKLECRAEGEYVNISATYTVDEVRALAQLGASFAPRPRSLNQLPPPPPPEEGQGGESGNSPEEPPSADDG